MRPFQWQKESGAPLCDIQSVSLVFNILLREAYTKLAYKTLCGCRQDCGKLDKPLHITSHEPALVGVEDWVYRAEN